MRGSVATYYLFFPDTYIYSAFFNFAQALCMTTGQSQLHTSSHTSPPHTHLRPVASKSGFPSPEKYDTGPAHSNAVSHPAWPMTPELGRMARLNHLKALVLARSERHITTETSTTETSTGNPKQPCYNSARSHESSGMATSPLRHLHTLCTRRFILPTEYNREADVLTR